MNSAKKSGPNNIDVEKNIRHSIAGIVVVDNLVLIGRRIPVGQMGGRWEFPGGKVEEGETYEQAVVREFTEEFSLKVIVGKHITDASFEHNNETVMLHAYQVFIPNEQDVNWVLTEHTEVKWIHFSEIANLNFVDSDKLIYSEVRKYFE